METHAMEEPEGSFDETRRLLWESLPDEVLVIVGQNLTLEETAIARCACSSLARALPSVRLVKGRDFDEHGPRTGNLPRLPYVDAFEIHRGVSRIDLSCRWKDQGWGYQKGQFITQLLRRIEEGADEFDVLAETNEPLGLAPHCSENGPPEYAERRFSYTRYEDDIPVRNTLGSSSGTLDESNQLVSAARPGDRIQVSLQPPQRLRCVIFTAISRPVRCP